MRTRPPRGWVSNFAYFLGVGFFALFRGVYESLIPHLHFLPTGRGLSSFASL